MCIGPKGQRYGSSWSKTKKDAIPVIHCGAMDGAGRCTSRMHPTSRLQLTTRRIAWVVMFRLSQLTGYTCKVTRSSKLSKQNTNTDRKHFKEICNAKVSVSDDRWLGTDCLSCVLRGGKTGGGTSRGVPECRPD